jgi:putative hydrolase of the HAD superfamily
MAAIVGLPVPEFLERYWEHRQTYDRGQSSREYWSTVARPGVALDERTVAELVDRDNASWSEINDETVRVLEGAAGRLGARLAVLSNAPHDFANVISGHPALAGFDPLLFSCRLGAAKPDRAAFQAALDELRAPARDVLFVDDRDDNVEAAIAAGLQAIRFTSPEDLRSGLDGHSA